MSEPHADGDTDNKDQLVVNESNELNNPTEKQEPAVV
jgi:hypothetical protein